MVQVLHAEVTTLVTCSQSAAKAPNRGELARCIQFRGNLEFLADVVEVLRDRVGGMGQWKSARIANLDRVSRWHVEKFARIRKRMRIVVNTYEVVILW